ncbi:MAG: STAS domain-containing protein [Streptosporangiaceae bacterium]|nr:STAS domain-containing protein [Streptosporangiaceae bacterium]
MWLWSDNDTHAAWSGRPVGQVSVHVYVGPEATTVAVSGELDLMTMPLVARELAQVLRERPRRLILDMAGIGFMDCGSARLIVAAGRCLPPGQRPVIRGASRAVLRVLQITGLDACCEIQAADGKEG